LRIAQQSVIFTKKEDRTVATKTANVSARVEPEIKEQAEQILDNLGIPISVLINSLYRQIIYNNGVPFSLTMPVGPKSREEMTAAEFDARMETGYQQALAGQGRPAKDVFADLQARISE